MWRRMLRNIYYNWNQVVAGLEIVLVSLVLWIDKSYFTWPPELRPAMNSKYADIFYLCLGIMLLLFAITNKDIRISKKWTVKDITLTIAGGATLVLLLEHGLQVVFAHNMEMAIGVILDLSIFMLTFRCAYDS